VSDGEPGAVDAPVRLPAEAREPMRQVERALTVLFRRARSSSRALAGLVHPDLDPPSYELLVAVRQLLVERPGDTGVRAADVVGLTGSDKSTVSRGLERLAGLGLLQRVPDPRDARARLLALSPLGTERLEEVATKRRAALAAALARWPHADLVELGRLMTLLIDDLDLTEG
jgi:DNA-binding MarR family transcriptional regulator